MNQEVNDESAINYDSFSPFTKNTPMINQAHQNPYPQSDILEASKSFTQLNFLQLIRVDRIVNRMKNKLLSRAYIYSNFQKSRVSQYFKEKYLSNTKAENIEFSLLFNIQAIDPSTKLYILWDSFYAFALAVMFWILPFNWSFGEFPNLPLPDVIIGFLSISIFDIILKLNTAYFEQGCLVQSRVKILSHYLSYDVFFDAVALISLFLILSERQLIDFAIGPIIVALSLKLSNSLHYVNEIISFNSLWREIQNLFKLLFQINFFAHIIACVWHFVGQHSSFLGQTWIQRQNIENESMMIKYCHSYYFATLTMVTVGYGDITPTNYIEILSCIIIMFIACGMFAYCLSRIGQIISNINDSRANLELNLRIMTKYMKQHQIPSSLQNRVQNYLEYISSEKQEQDTESINKIMENLSTNLRTELMYSIFKNVLKSNLILKNFSEDTLKTLSNEMRELDFCPSEEIFQQSSYNDHSLFFIYQGQVKLYEEHTQTDLHILQKGDSFGELGFFTEQERTCSAVSVGFSKIYKIQRNTFLNIITQNEREIFHQISQSLAQDISCYGCQEQGHIILNCPYLHYKPNLERLILQDKNSQQERDNNYDRPRQKINTLYFSKYFQAQHQLLEEQSSAFIKLNQVLPSESESEFQPTQQLKTSLEKFDSNEEEEDIMRSRFRKTTKLKQTFIIVPPSSHEVIDQQKKSSHKCILPSVSIQFQESINELDRMAEFKHFLPHNNYVSVILQYNKKRKQKQKPRNLHQYTLFEGMRR